MSSSAPQGEAGGKQHTFFNFDDNDPDPQGLLANADDVDLPDFFWDLDDQGGTVTNGNFATNNVDTTLKLSTPAGYSQVFSPPLSQIQQVFSVPQHQANQQEQQTSVPGQDQQNIGTVAPTQFNNSDFTSQNFLSDLAQQIAAGGAIANKDNEKGATDASATFNFNGVYPNVVIPQRQQTSVATTTQGQQGDTSNYQQNLLSNPSWNVSQHNNVHQHQQMQKLVNSVAILPKLGGQTPQITKDSGSSVNGTNTTPATVQQRAPEQRQPQQSQQSQFFALPPPPTQLRPSPAAPLFSPLPSDSQQHQQQNIQIIQQLQQQQQQQYDINQVFALGNATNISHQAMLPPQQQFTLRQSQQQQGHSVSPYCSQIVPLTQGGAPASSEGAKHGAPSTCPILLTQHAPVSTQVNKNTAKTTAKYIRSAPSTISRKRHLQTDMSTPATDVASNKSNNIVSCSSDTEGEAHRSSPSAPSCKNGGTSKQSDSLSTTTKRSSVNPGSIKRKKEDVFSNSQEEEVRRSDVNVLPSSAPSFRGSVPLSSLVTKPVMAAVQPACSSNTKKKKQPNTVSGKDNKISSGNLSADGSSFIGDAMLEDEMTEQERALANRLRNREHARNTRARKKAYLESLKSTLDELCRERDTLVSERAGAASLLLEMQKTRTDVLLSFFAVRSCYEKRRALWSSILDESVTCVMPVTPYRSFPASEVQVSKCQRTILGVDGIIADTASLHVLLNSLVDRSKHPDKFVRFRYTLIAEEAVVSGNQIMARWNMSTSNAKSLGAKMEVAKMGMLCARFNSAHKIVAIDLMFDVMAFMLQLKQSAVSCAFHVVPNTVQTCVGPFGNKPIVMTSAERPYTIVQVNRQWEEMTGWKAEDVVGKASCNILQGQCTERAALEELMSNIRYKRPASAVLTNYMRGRGCVFRNFINVYPLSTDSKISHYLAVTVHFKFMESNLLENSAETLEKSKDEDIANKTETMSYDTSGINKEKQVKGASPNSLNRKKSQTS